MVSRKRVAPENLREIRRRLDHEDVPVVRIPSRRTPGAPPMKDIARPRPIMEKMTRPNSISKIVKDHWGTISDVDR